MAADGFVPLQRRTGMFVGDFVSAHAGHDLVVWGAGVLGRCLMHQLARYAALGQMLAFTDSNPHLAGTMIDGKVVLALAEAMQRTHAGTAFLIVALSAHTNNAMGQLAGAGLSTGVDYESYIKLSRPEAVIQISGGDGELLAHMGVDTYKKILAKLKTDIPDLFHVDLSGWGDPLDHPKIDAIVKTTRAVVPCTLTTRLNTDLAVIERALQAAPTQFVVSVDGERDHAFFDRLCRVADLQNQLAGCTEIRVKYTRFRDNDAGIQNLRAHCAELGLKLVEAIGYIDPYDTTLALCKAGDFDGVEASRLAWSLRDALDLAHADRARPCLCQRIFPVINPDGSVGVCHLYSRVRLHDSYLDVEYDKLQDLRHDAAHCRVCQHHSLHRLDVDVLQARYRICLITVPESTYA